MATTCSEDQYVISRYIVNEFEDTETLPLPGETVEKQNGKSRYQKYSERSQNCAIDATSFEAVAKGKYSTTWKGITLMKDCFSLIAYQELLWELKPRTILEFGTARGGSTLWLNDIMSAYGLDFHVYTIDIDTEQCDQKAKEAKHVTFLKGDCYKPEETFTPEMLKNFPHPWLIIDDAHVNVCNLWEYLHKFMHRGDYYIQEDTNHLIESFYPPGPIYSVPEKDEDGKAVILGLVDFSETKPHLNFVRNKAEEVTQFMKGHGSEYRVDAKYVDFFGTNSTWSMNSMFVKL